MPFRLPAAKLAAAAFTLAAAGAGPAHASVERSDPGGFVVGGTLNIERSPEQVWALLGRPADWWEASHTFSGSAANLSLEPRAGGCFCEALPGSGGSVAHMQVVHARPAGLLVLDGALGPLQGEAVTGRLTIELVPDAQGQGTRLTWVYVVGGYSRTPLATLAGPVDSVMATQFSRLAAKAGEGR